MDGPTETWKALFRRAAGFSYRSSQIWLGNEGEETGQLLCSAMRKCTVCVMKPAAAGQWEQAGAIFVRCEQSIERVRPYHLPSLPSPPLSSTVEIFPKRSSFPFLLAELITIIIFSFISEQVSFGSLWWLPLSAVIVLLWLSDLQLGHTRHCETWESIYQYLQVGKSPLTSHLLDVEAGSVSPRVILRAEIWIWTGHSFHRWKINSKCFHPIRCNEKKYIIKMVISAPIAEFSVIFMTLFSEQSF